jgi:hypothetical protein
LAASEIAGMLKTWIAGHLATYDLKIQQSAISSTANT